MWKRLQRVGKEASKFQFTISILDLIVDCQNDWYPSCVYVVWSRRGRKECSETHPLVADPDVKNRFLVSLTVPDNLVTTVTLFRNSRNSKFEAKEWDFTIYEFDTILAHQLFNLSDFASHRFNQVTTDLPLKSKHKKVVTASIHFTVSSSLVKKGKATDDDMISISSFMSMTKDHHHSDDDNHGDDGEEEVDDVTKDIKSRKDNKNFVSGKDALKIKTLAERYNLANYLEKHDAIIDDTTESTIESSTPSTSQKFNISTTSTTATSHNKPPPSSSSTTTRNKATTSPTQDLLKWCQEVTNGYKNMDVTNLTTSWRNGMAFCAIIHHYRPDLIDFESLDSSDVRGNCKLAFDIGERLGVPKVIEPSDMVLLKVPDKLSVLTYLFQLKSYFTDDHSDIMSTSLTSSSKNSIIRSPNSGGIPPRFNMDQFFTSEEKRMSNNNIRSVGEVGDGSEMECRSPSPYSVVSTTCTSFSPTPVASLERNHNKRIDRDSKIDKNINPAMNYNKNLILKNDLEEGRNEKVENNSLIKAPPRKNKKEKNQTINNNYHDDKINEIVTNPSNTSSLSSNIETNAIIPVAANNNFPDNNISDNKPKLMTRKQLLNPFDSDEEDENEESKLKVNLNLKSAPGDHNTHIVIDSNTLPQVHEVKIEGKGTERGTQENKDSTTVATKVNGVSNVASENIENIITVKQIDNISRQENLRERARLLLAQAKVSKPKHISTQSQKSSSSSKTMMAAQQQPPSSPSTTISSSSMTPSTPTSSLSSSKSMTLPADQSNDSPSLHEKYLRDQQDMNKRHKELQEKARQLIMGARGSRQVTEVIRRSSGSKGFNDSPQSSRSNNLKKENSLNKGNTTVVLSGVVDEGATVYCNDELFSEDDSTQSPKILDDNPSLAKIGLKPPADIGSKSNVNNSGNGVSNVNTSADDGIKISGKGSEGSNENNQNDHNQNNVTIGSSSNSPDKSMYVTTEMEQLEKEQLSIDEKAASLEWELRRVMKEGDKDGMEDKMLKEWFGLVNRKNALIRRQMQLNLLEKEKDLEKRFDLLSVELRNIMSLPDWQKTEEKRQREKMLLAELVEIVDRRNELVQNLDCQEQAIEEDEKVEMAIGENLGKKRPGRWGKIRGGLVGCDGGEASCVVQ